MNKVLTLAALLCMSVSGTAFSEDMMKDMKADAKHEMKAEAKKEMKAEAEKSMDKEMPKDAKAAKEMGMEAAAHQHSYKEITASELKNWMDSKEQMVLIDARDKKTFDKGHIEGAVNLPADKVSKAELEKLAKAKDAKLVFYCGDTTCPASKNAAEAAAKLGYTNLYKVPGGYAEWQKEGYKTTTAM